MENTILDKDFALGGKKRRILLYPNPALDMVGEEVTEFNDEIKTLAQDMLTTMYDAPGIGLAAQQIGINKRIFVLDVNYDREITELENGGESVDFDNLQPVVFINPKIIKKEGDTTYQEGCLSLPGIYEDIKRAEKVTVEYQDITGATNTIEADGLFAICIQHENDHIDGITFLKYLSNFKRNYYKQVMVKEKKKRGISING